MFWLLLVSLFPRLLRSKRIIPPIILCLLFGVILLRKYVSFLCLFTPLCVSKVLMDLVFMYDIRFKISGINPPLRYKVFVGFFKKLTQPRVKISSWKVSRNEFQQTVDSVPPFSFCFSVSP